MFTMSAGEPPKFVAAVREMDRVIVGLPPLPRSEAGEAGQALLAGQAVLAATTPHEELLGAPRGAA